jgi:hypothetical protein
MINTLRCLAKGNFFGDLHGISKSSVCVAMEGVLSSICRSLNNIHFPTDPCNVRKTKMGFYRLARFPNVLGAIDGTLIKIQAPNTRRPVLCAERITMH